MPSQHTGLNRTDGSSLSTEIRKDANHGSMIWVLAVFETSWGPISAILRLNVSKSANCENGETTRYAYDVQLLGSKASISHRECSDLLKLVHDGWLEFLESLGLVVIGHASNVASRRGWNSVILFGYAACIETWMLRGRLESLFNAASCFVIRHRRPGGVALST